MTSTFRHDFNSPDTDSPGPRPNTRAWNNNSLKLMSHGCLLLNLAVFYCCGKGSKRHFSKHWTKCLRIFPWSKEKSDGSFPAASSYVLAMANKTTVFPYSELVRSNDHHKPYNIKPSFNNHSIEKKYAIRTIRNQNKRKSSLNLVVKLENSSVNLLLWRVVTTVSLYRLTDSLGKQI